MLFAQETLLYATRDKAGTGPLQLWEVSPPLFRRHTIPVKTVYNHYDLFYKFPSAAFLSLDPVGRLSYPGTTSVGRHRHTPH